ncbi:MAG: imidazole glycerol phosphate synthase subunit HisH [Candidatus Saelkia tenebricola]|nr:imidazole glycerol phosphate synthase subunit HisH [Candidatus Saelkia tenebricola]
MKVIAVIDYHMGNLHSVAKALEYVSLPFGFKICVTNEVDLILSADAIVLPGVGAFGKGVENLKKIRIFDVLKKRITEGVPFLGICLGLQLLFTESQEHGNFQGLGLIEGKVVRFSAGVKIPHMGWNQVFYRTKEAGDTLFKNMRNEEYFYFVHSYYVSPVDEKVILSTTNYGVEFASVVKKDNIYGVQFHPEKSSSLGLDVFSNFIKLII